MKYKLYGDGIHDDYPAIQEMIDSGACEVRLPVPEKFYVITKTLRIPSNFRLILPRFAEIRLADGSDCFMITNRWTVDRADRIKVDMSELFRCAFATANEVSPAPEHVSENFEIVGGVWNMNNKHQRPNPLMTHDFSEGCAGYGMIFYNVRNFRLADLTLKDPVVFAVMIDHAEYFTVENITFDFNFGNPCAANMDGIHLYGNCRHGYIRNLKGACYDDLVALNTDEGMGGPISHITIDGIFAEECHSAVRLLASAEKIDHVHITNVHGTFYQYCIALSKYYPAPKEEWKGLDDVSIDHIYASKATRYPHLHPRQYSYVYPLIWIEDEAIAKNLTIEAVHRREYNVPVETISVGAKAEIGTLIIRDVTIENYTGKPMPAFVNHGHIKSLDMKQVRTDGDDKLNNNGSIDFIDD